jgi:hypothetical protein
MSRGSLTLKGSEKKVEVEGREHAVNVIGGGAEFEKSRSSKKLLRIKITAELDGVMGDCEVTCGRCGEINATRGRAYARSDAPGGREADAERFSALVKVLTGRRPWVYRRSDDTIKIVCGM